MSLVCSRCRFFNLDAARYCEECGAALGETAGRALRIGRAADNDVVLSMPVVSARHGTLWIEEDSLVIEDHRSANGTFLNSPDNPAPRAAVEPGDSVYFGAYRVAVKRLLQSAGLRQERLYPLAGESLEIGRDPQCGLVLDHVLVAPRHALLSPGRNGQWGVRNLAPAYRTFVNGEPLNAVKALQPGDKLSFGPFQFELQPEGLVQAESGRGFTLDLRNLSVVANLDRPDKRKTLLDSISAVIYPGEFCGLMGLAGAGKTTLMKAANGYLTPSFGAVYVNGQDLYEHYDMFRVSIGYVPQEDIFHKELTVGQALAFAARLRLGHQLAAEEVDGLINGVLERLAMFEANPQIRETKIANISGGQKRRVNIAIELLTDPGIFFLDEPTSGLSSEDALIVMKLLRGMAEQGKTILTTLHQPSMEIYELMDNVIYLHKGGKLSYYGPTVPDSIAFTNPDLPLEEAYANPEAALRALDRQPASYWRKRYRESPYCREFVTRRQKQASQSEGAHAKRKEIKRYAWDFSQWMLLHSRNFAVKLQDRMNSLILLLQAPVIAALIALVFSGEADEAYRNAPTALYLVVIASMWFGCSNAARDICGEWAIYQRERMFNLMILPYVASKFTIGCLVSLIQCLILTLIVGGFCHMQAPLVNLLAISWLTALAGVAIGLLVSAFASPFKKSNEIAVGLIPIVLLPMVILGGIIKPFKDMNTTTAAVAALMPTRWSFEAALLTESDHNVERVTLDTPLGKKRTSKKQLIREQFFEDGYDGRAGRALGIVLLMCFVSLGATAALLKQKDLV